MKKTILALLSVFSLGVMAQEKPVISTAIIAMNKSDLTEAKAQIDRAGKIIADKGGSTDEKQMSKYLYHKGLIYYRIAINKDESISQMAPNGVDTAAKYYSKLLAFEKTSGKDRYTKETIGQLPYVINGITNRAYTKNANQDYEGAAKDFMTVYKAWSNPALGEYAKTDTTSYYYAGVSTLFAGDAQGAAKIMEEVLEMGYNGYTWLAYSVVDEKEARFATKAQMDRATELAQVKDGHRSESMRIEVYKTLLNAYAKAEDTENFNKTLAAARAEYPDDGDLVKQQLQVYLDSEEYEKALTILEEAIAAEPDNAILHYVKGYIYQNTEAIKNDSIALAAYGKALEIDPDNFECLYNSGAIWYGKGKALVDQMNELGMSAADQKKYDKLKKEKEALFAKSLPYFEKAYESNPDDLGNVQALFQCYRQLGMNEKAMEFKKIMDELQATSEG